MLSYNWQTKLLVKYVLLAFVFGSVLVLIRHRAAYDEGPGTPVPKPHIFSVETKRDKRHLSPREACSVESAALHHPGGSVTVFNINGEFQDDRYADQLLLNYPNVRFLGLNISEAFDGTPLEAWNRLERILESKFPVEHLSDALRLALLWKQGGIYMDTDTIVINPLTNLTNAIGLESEFAATGLLAFQQNSYFLYNYMAQFAVNYDGQDWGAQGPTMVTNLLKQWCRVYSLKFVVNQPSACQGIEILPRHKFYPVEWFDWLKLFGSASDVGVDFSDSYAVHLFGSKSRDHLVRVGDGSFIEALFTNNCPKTALLVQQQGYL